MDHLNSLQWLVKIGGFVSGCSLLTYDDEGH